MRWRESGERNVRYFYNLDKQNCENKTMTKLKRSNGTFTSDQVQVLREQMDYYKRLYTSDKQPKNLHDSKSAFTENITPLDDTDKLMCEGKVSAEECLKALNDFKNEKSPGTDGLPRFFF